MKLGVITDGISRDFERALNVMAEYGLRYPELQFVWDREVGDHDAEQVARMKALLDQHDMEVSCISRHIFGGLPVLQTEVGDAAFEDHVSGLRRCIALAKTLGTNIVRIMGCKKEMILFGYNGAEDWIVTAGAWDKLVKLMAVPVQIAEEEGVTLVVETGNNAMITSGFLARKLIDELGSSHLKLLWDIPNTMYCTDVPFPMPTMKFAIISAIFTSKTQKPILRARLLDSIPWVKAMWDHIWNPLQTRSNAIDMRARFLTKASIAPKAALLKTGSERALQNFWKFLVEEAHHG